MLNESIHIYSITLPSGYAELTVGKEIENMLEGRALLLKEKTFQRLSFF